MVECLYLQGRHAGHTCMGPKGVDVTRRSGRELMEAKYVIVCSHASVHSASVDVLHIVIEV